MKKQNKTQRKEQVLIYTQRIKKLEEEINFKNESDVFMHEKNKEYVAYLISENTRLYLSSKHRKELCFVLIALFITIELIRFFL